jgi:predicted DNA binding protein
MEGLTISEMAKELGIKPHSVTVRLNRAGIKPMTNESLYAPDTLDKIREAKRGRPKKPAQ